MHEVGWDLRRVRHALKAARGLDAPFGNGSILGSMCTQPLDIAAEAYSMFLETNLGDPAHFPGTASLEEELLRDVQDLVQAPSGAGARLLSGGTEANLLALYAARERSGRRNVVLPESAHFSFEKAARMLDMDLIYVPTTPSGHADPGAMARAVDGDTAIMVAVAGTTELGLVDPVAELGAIAQDLEVPLHVDAAYGGYILPFMRDADRLVMPFDFTVPGVWSMTIDPHKMGMAPIPAGVLVLADEADFAPITVASPYVSTAGQASVTGTRPGAAAAAAWAVHRHLGRKGFASVVETCLDNAAYLAARLSELGVELVAAPELTVVAFRSGDPVQLHARLAEAGFRLNIVPRLGALRIVVNPHVEHATIERFLETLEDLL